MSDGSGEVFISWSGDTSHAVAEQLKAWIPLVVSGPRCWLSSRDLPAGRIWVTELFNQLQLCNVGIVVLTPDNVNSSWMLFEAGALCKNLKVSRVLPYLIGLKKSELRGPFAEFQAIEANRDGTRRLIHTIRDVHPSPESRAITDQRFDMFWPSLSKELEASEKIRPECTFQPLASVVDYQVAISRLESQITGLTEMIRDVVQNGAEKTSPDPQRNSPTCPMRAHVEQLVGSWRNVSTGSHGYARLINGSLHMPYCYSGNYGLTAAFTDWSLLGSHWFARFKWFDGSYRGFALHKMKDNALDGQWWLDGDLELTPSIIEVIERTGSHPKGTYSRWVRVKEDLIPEWAERYFRDIETQRAINPGTKN